MMAVPLPLVSSPVHCRHLHWFCLHWLQSDGARMSHLLGPVTMMSPKSERDYAYGEEVYRIQPDIVVQDSFTRHLVPACSGCLRSIGSLMDHMLAATGEYRFSDLFGARKAAQELPSAKSEGLPMPDWAAGLQKNVFMCPRGCGEIYCSEECWKKAESSHHFLFCVGPLTEEDSIYKFKELALESVLPHYELLMMAAQILCRLAKGDTDYIKSYRHIHSLPLFWDYINENSPSADWNPDGESHTWESQDHVSFSYICNCYEHLEMGLEKHRLYLPDWCDHSFFSKLITWLEISSVWMQDLVSPLYNYTAFIEENDLKEALSSDLLCKVLSNFDERDTEEPEKEAFTLEDLQDIQVPSTEGFAMCNGIGIFPHSCCPNLEIGYEMQNNKLCVVIQAKHKIRKGDLLSISYFRTRPRFEEMAYEDRIFSLDKLGLKCICNSCKSVEYMKGKHHEKAMLDHLGEVALEEHRYEDACNLYEMSLRAEEDANSFHNYGRALLNLGQWKEGYEIWEEGAKKFPHHKDLQATLKTKRYFSGSSESQIKSSETCEKINKKLHHVYRTCNQILDQDNCEQMIQECEKYASDKSGWTTSRHYSIPTTDIPVHDLVSSLSHLNWCLEHKIFPLISRYYGENVQDLRVHDAFIVKYSMEGQRHLPIHTDQSHYSATIALNSLSCYTGGGVLFPDFGVVGEVDVGKAILFRGDQTHGGRAILSGVRYIIALFIYSLNYKNNLL